MAGVGGIVEVVDDVEKLGNSVAVAQAAQGPDDGGSPAGSQVVVEEEHARAERVGAAGCQQFLTSATRVIVYLAAYPSVGLQEARRAAQDGSM